MQPKTAPHLIPVHTSAISAEEGAPAPGRILAGHPVNRTWNVFESPDGQFFSGIWESEPGTWRIEYTEAEFCHIMEGVSRITSDNGLSVTLRAGDAFVIPSGFRGTWEVVARTRKHYAIYLPGGAGAGA